MKKQKVDRMDRDAPSTGGEAARTCAGRRGGRVASPSISGLTRRDFLKGTTGSVLIGMAGASSSPKATRENSNTNESKQTNQTSKKSNTAQKSRVVLVRDQRVIDKDGKLNPILLAGMLDQGVTKLLDADNPKTAWPLCFKKDDTLGIKTNVWQFLRTPPELEQIIRSRAVECGIAAEQIAIDDRNVLYNPVFQNASALVNIRPLRTHHWSGVGGCIKNYIMFSKSPPKWHPDSCADLAGVWNLPLVRGKTRLNILVVLTPLFHGKGPHHFQARYQWPYKGLLIGTDPVAVDAVGLRILENKRNAYFGKQAPLVTSAKHIEIAQTRHGLGIADPNRIEVIKIGWMEEALI